MSGTCVKMITGLGNPGKNYSQTRHNIGFLVIDKLASLNSLELNKSRFDAKYQKSKINGFDLLFVKPQSYMNRSGFPIQKFASYYKIDISDIIIIHDDLDLAFGQIKIVENRGHGGHNGVRSVIDVLGSREFVRLRIGVGRPGHGKDVTGHVLGGFSAKEKDILDSAIDHSIKACMSIIEDGVKSAMNQWNSKK